jgi:hypothetical protein
MTGANWTGFVPPGDWLIALGSFCRVIGMPRYGMQGPRTEASRQLWS